MQSPAPATADAVFRVERATQASEAARKEVERRDEEIGKAFGSMYGALDTDQQARGLKAERDRPEYQAAIAARDAAAHELRESLADPSVRALAESGRSPITAGIVANGYAELAETKHAGEAVQWAADVANGPQSARDAYAKGLGLEGDEALGKHLQDKVVVPGVPNAAAALVGTNDPFGGFKEVAKNATAVAKLAKDNEAQKKVEDAMKHLDNMRSPIKAEREMAKGVLERYGDSWAGDSKTVRAITGAGLMMNAVEAHDAAARGDNAQLINKLAEAGGKSAELSAVALKSMTTAGSAALREVATSPAALKAANTLARVTPVLGVVANGAALTVHARDAMNGKAPVMNSLAVAGDAIALLGSVTATGLMWAPPGFVAGEALAGIGTTISTIAELGASIESAGADAAKLAQDRREFLQNAGLTDRHMIAELANPGTDASRFAKDMNLTPPQVRQFISENPGVISHAAKRETVERTARSLGYSGERLPQLMETMRRHRGGLDGGINAASRVLFDHDRTSKVVGAANNHLPLAQELRVALGLPRYAR